LQYTPNQMARFLGSNGRPNQSYLKSQKIVQFTDSHFFNDGSEHDKRVIETMEIILDRVKPDLVVLTGDTIDGRFCQTYECFSQIVAPMIKRGIPWTYTPGNHDDETDEYNRKDLLNVFRLPCCISKSATSFTHSIQLGPVQVYLIDSNAYLGSHSSYDFIHEEQINEYLAIPSLGEVGLAFFHIPIPEYKTSKILIGQKQELPCSPKHNSGFFSAVKQKGDTHAMFVGHDHWNDYVSELDGIWLGYGRLSGYSHPSYYGSDGEDPDPENLLKTPARGARVIQYHSGTKELSTWTEVLEGKVSNSFLTKTITTERSQTMIR